MRTLSVTVSPSDNSQLLQKSKTLNLRKKIIAICVTNNPAHLRTVVLKVRGGVLCVVQSHCSWDTVGQISVDDDLKALICLFVVNVLLIILAPREYDDQQQLGYSLTKYPRL